MTLLERIAARTATVAVVGLGRVGLPLAVAFARAGFAVMGVDGDDARRSAIELGKMPFHLPAAEEPLHDAVGSGRLTVHPRLEDVAERAHIVVLAVATPIAADLRPDYGQLRGALRELAPHIRPGQLLILRSTVSPGTLQKVVLPALRASAPNGAEGVLLAACPERIAEGRAMEELVSLPEIVGGIDAASTEAAAALFRSLGPDKRIHLTDPTSAELAKLFTNVYRYVNFALANEFGILAEQYGVDARRVIEMANADYPRANIPTPGPAGGPCLSKDGYFLVEELTMPDFVLLAWKLNDSIPAHVVHRLRGDLQAEGVRLNGAPVAVLGRAFKRDSDDTRQSPSVRIAEILEREGAAVRSHDPFLPGPSLDDALAGAAAFVLATNHSAYDHLRAGDVAALMAPPRLGFDCWGSLDREAYARAGVRVRALGVGTDAGAGDGMGTDTGAGQGAGGS